MGKFPCGARAPVYAFCVLLAIMQVRCADPFGPDDERPFPFKVYSGYSVRSSFGEDGSTYGLVFTDKAGFDAVLYMIGDHNPHPPIPETDFQTRIFPVVIKRGNNYWVMDVDRVRYIQNGKILNVYVKSTLVAEDMSWVASIPLVLSVQALDYSVVNLYENDEFLTSVPLNR